MTIGTYFIDRKDCKVDLYGTGLIRYVNKTSYNLIFEIRKYLKLEKLVWVRYSAVIIQLWLSLIQLVLSMFSVILQLFL